MRVRGRPAPTSTRRAAVNAMIIPRNHRPVAHADRVTAVTVRSTAGTGWDLEAAVFQGTVPGIICNRPL
jgi:hypothetical protein